MTFLRNNIVLVIEFQLRKITKRSSWTPNDTLCPCARFESFVGGSSKVVLRGNDMMATGSVLGLVYDLVFPV